MHLTRAKSVEQFFLNIYRRQVEAAPDDKVRIVRVSVPPSSANRVFELQVQKEDELKKRRMTIGPLGETSGSKSQCFYVIYDTHMVLKVPPVPIKDFDDYIRRIRNEAHIVKKLAPKECIIPNVSVILKAIHTFRDTKYLSEEELESKYIQWLHMHPEYQEYLKIDNSFIFFMDLSRYYFLSHVVDGLHVYQQEIEKEIVHDAAIVQDGQRFIEKYGKRYEKVSEQLQQIFGDFEEKVKMLMGQSKEEIPPSEKHKREWFVTHLARGKIEEKAFGHSNAFLLEIRMLLKRIFEINPAIAKNYRKITTQFLRHRSFARNRNKMEGLITNLLDLLEWLGKCDVAMRDLKPDNLLVAGNPDHYPNFLSTPEDYSIGLIDVEISIDYNPERGHRSVQPTLAGTPLFATPSHFFQNNILSDVYGDLKKVFHMQDWHAMVAIMYEVVTGEHLYPGTAARFPSMVERFQKYAKAEGNMSDAFKLINSMFWKTAAQEMKRNIAENENWFKAMTVALPKETRNRLTDFVRVETQKTNRHIDMIIQKQSVFKGAENHRRLQRYTAEDINRFKTKYEKSGQATDQSRSVSTKIINLLDKLAHLKYRTAHYSAIAEKLRNTDSKLSVKILFELLFGVIQQELHESIQDARIEGKLNKMFKRKPNLVKEMPKNVKGMKFTTTFEK
jgi:serine/threonine protein kinase